MREVFILRGLPGSGKSTLAKKLLMLSESNAHHEADSFMMVDDVYEFNVNKLGYAHNSCFLEYQNSLKNNVEVVVVSNTATTYKEFEKYYNLAKQNNYQVTVLVVENRNNTHNIHGVPDEKLQEMANRFDLKLY